VNKSDQIKLATIRIKLATSRIKLATSRIKLDQLQIKAVVSANVMEFLKKFGIDSGGCKLITPKAQLSGGNLNLW